MRITFTPLRWLASAIVETLMTDARVQKAIDTMTKAAADTAVVVTKINDLKAQLAAGNAVTEDDLNALSAAADALQTGLTAEEGATA